MPAQRAIREKWTRDQLQRKLVDEWARTTIARAKKAGNRLGGLMWFKYGNKELAIQALKIPAELMILQQYGIMPELWTVAAKQAVKWIFKRASFAHGATVLPSQKAQYEWTHTH